MEKNKIFLFDPLKKKAYSYAFLWEKLNTLKSIPVFICEKDLFTIFINIIASILCDKSIVLLDYDFKQSELLQLGVSSQDLLKQEKVILNEKINEKTIVDLIHASKNWQITLFTSGTTGQPKKIIHTLKSISRMVKISDKRIDDIWGFAYNPTHIAGLQVFFQAILNLNTIVNIFELVSSHIFSVIDEYKITNISATPTFFRMLVPNNQEYNTVKKITSGGENLNPDLFNRISKIFPKAKILNVYASTEAGSLFASEGDIFKIKEQDLENVKIVNGELWIHKDLLGLSDSIELNGDWYNTNDMVEPLLDDKLKFRFIGRKNEMLNIGGYKVNPGEVESVINNYPGVLISKVYSKKNSVLGNILFADVTLSDFNITEKELKAFLKLHLQTFKIPRIINLVNSVEITRTGKLRRV
jgi:acyl-coenzyme A synthetase/AMP-(fatty) acid ligase